MATKNPYLSSRIVIPAAMLLFMLSYFIMAIDLGTFFVQDSTGEAFFPFILGILGSLLAIKILTEALKDLKKDQAEGKEIKSVQIKTPMILAGISFLYITALHFIGLIPALLGYVFFFMMFFDDKIQHLLRKLIYSVIISGVVYVLYYVIFKVQFDKIFFNYGL